MKAPRILHYPGSKWAVADWIISHMPQHTTYVEPFFGSGAILFNKNPAKLETINDIDGNVVNLYRVIREQPDELSRLLQWTPYSRQEYYAAHEKANSDIEQARRFLVRCWQSIRVKTGSISGWKCRGTPDDVYNVRQWNELPSKIQHVADRLKNVQIDNRPANELIKRHRSADTLLYIDPPYLPDTWSTVGGKMYDNEMTADDHIELLGNLQMHPGPVILSGYASKLYDEILIDWQKETKAGKPVNGEARTEVIWINPVAAQSANQALLF